MASRLGNAFANDLLATRVTGVALWVTLCQSDPGPEFDAATEAFGPGYARQPITFGPSNGRTVLNTNGGSWSNLAAGNYWGLAVMTAAGGGVMVWRAPFTDGDGAPVTLSATQLVGAAFRPGDIALTL